MSARVRVCWGLLGADVCIGFLCLLSMNFRWIPGEGGLAVIPVLWGTLAAFPVLLVIAGLVTRASAKERHRDWEQSLGKIGQQKKKRIE